MRDKVLQAVFVFFVLTLAMVIPATNTRAQDKKVIRDNNKKVLGVAQKVIDKTVYVSVMPVLEALGWNVVCDPADRSVFCTKEGSLLMLKAESTVAILDGEDITLEKPVTVSDGIIYAPSKFIAREFGVQIRWKDKENLIILSSYDEDNIYIEGAGNIVIAGNGIIVNIFEAYTKDTAHDMLSYADRLLGKNGVDEAIEIYKDVLKNVDLYDHPEMYMHALINMGNAYCLLAEVEDVKNNATLAIRQYESVLDLCKTEYTIDSYVSVLSNLGNAYRILSDITNDRYHLDRAVEVLTEAQEYCDDTGSFMEKALIHNNLGLAYLKLGMRDAADTNLSEAEGLYRKALELHTLENDSYLYALIQFNLGNICMVFLEADDIKTSLKKSKSAYLEALKAWGVECYPANYARIHKSLGDMYSRIYQIDGHVENLRLALKEYDESLQIFSLKNCPMDYAKVNMGIGDIYFKILLLKGDLFKGDYRLLKKSIISYQKALKILRAF